MANEIPLPKLPKSNLIIPQRPQSNIKPDVKELPVQPMQGVGSGDAKPIIADRSLLFRDLGTTGLTRFGGGVYEEFLRELQGASGIAIFREMRDNHPVVSALLFAIEMSLRQVRWHAEPASDSPQDKEAAEFLDEAREDMSYTWNDTIAQVLTMLQFGFSLFELIYKVRRRGTSDGASRYDDAHIGWRKWMPLAQDTLSPGRQWIFDESGGVQGIHQQAPPDWQLRTIPIEKLLLFRTSVAKGNPEGRSLLRGMYTSYYYSKNMQEIEGIAAERMGAGMPVLYMGDNTTKSADGTSDLALAKQIVRDVRADEQMGVVIPYPKMGGGAKPGEGMLFELLSPPSRGVIDFDAVISRYDGRIALAALAQFIMLGLESHGSYALGRTHSDLFVMAIESWAESIAQIVNRHAVPRLFELNSFGVTDYPRLMHSEIEVNNLQEMAQYVNLLVGASVLTPDANLEAALRQKARLPEKQETVTVTTTNTDELPLDIQEAADQNEQENQLNRAQPPKPPQTIKPLPPKAPTTYSERFAARRAYGGARYETATNDYQAELERAYSDWYDGIAKKLSEAQTQDERDAILIPALPELEKQLKQSGRNGLLEAMQLGAGDLPLSYEGLAKLSELVQENDKYVENSLIPAVRTKVTESLNDPLFFAGGLAAITGLFDTFLGRIASYSGAFWEALHYGIKDNLMQLPDGMERQVRWVLDPGAEHCEDCPRNVGVYDSFDAMEATVGLPSQFVRCKQNCRCHVEVETVPGSGVFERL